MAAHALPKGWQDASAVLLAPVADELGDDWATIVPAEALVALAWQGLLRDLSGGEPVRGRPLAATALVQRSDVLFVSAEDIGAGGPPLEGLLRDGQLLFVTSGDRGAVQLARAEGRLHGRLVPPLPPRIAMDATGAGDTFLAAYVAARLSAPELLGTAQAWRLSATAAAVASMSVARVGLHGLPTLPELCRELVRPRL